MTISIFNFPAGEICSGALNLSDTSKFPDRNFKTSLSSNGYEARITSSGWCFEKDKAAYLKIDLTLDYVITQIATFGNKDRRKWMTSYTLKYSKDDITINSDGEVKVYIYIYIYTGTKYSGFKLYSDLYKLLFWNYDSFPQTGY